jgi:hypothetical protein
MQHFNETLQNIPEREPVKRNVDIKFSALDAFLE